MPSRQVAFPRDNAFYCSISTMKMMSVSLIHHESTLKIPLLSNLQAYSTTVATDPHFPMWKAEMPENPGVAQKPPGSEKNKV